MLFQQILLEDGGSQEGKEDCTIVFPNSFTNTEYSATIVAAQCGWSVRFASVPGAFGGQGSLKSLHFRQSSCDSGNTGLWKGATVVRRLSIMRYESGFPFQ